jgi:hypothetical protein
MLTTVHHDIHEAAAQQKADPYDLEKWLSISLIRSHTKTDDIPSVTDELLEVYRAAALQAAADYTGLRLTERMTVVEDVFPPVGTSAAARAGYFIHDLQYPTAQPDVWYYGHKNNSPMKLTVKINSRRLRLPIDRADFGLGCCNPCGPTAFSKVQYVAGYDCLSKAPVAIKLGALKYIAHAIENPGDLVRVSNEAGNIESGSVGAANANNPAVASGAIEIWRSVVADAI